MAKKLCEYQNEEAAEILADLIDPISEIASDKDVKENFKSSKMKTAKIILKKHGKPLIDILSIYEGIPREEYHVNPIGLVRKTFNILNDKDVMSVFTSQEQTEEN